MGACGVCGEHYCASQHTQRLCKPCNLWFCVSCTTKGEPRALPGEKILQKIKAAPITRGSLSEEKPSTWMHVGNYQLKALVDTIDDDDASETDIVEFLAQAVAHHNYPDDRNSRYVTQFISDTLTLKFSECCCPDCGAVI